MSETPELRSVDDMVGTALGAARTVARQAFNERLASLGLYTDTFTWESPDPYTPTRVMVTVNALDLCQLLEEKRDEAAQAHRALEVLGRKLDTLTAARETSETED